MNYRLKSSENINEIINSYIEIKVSRICKIKGFDKITKLLLIEYVKNRVEIEYKARTISRNDLAKVKNFISRIVNNIDLDRSIIFEKKSEKRGSAAYYDKNEENKGYIVVFNFDYDREGENLIKFLKTGKCSLFKKKFFHSIVSTVLHELYHSGQKGLYKDEDEISEEEHTAKKIVIEGCANTFESNCEITKLDYTEYKFYSEIVNKISCINGYQFMKHQSEKLDIHEIFTSMLTYNKYKIKYEEVIKIIADLRRDEIPPWYEEIYSYKFRENKKIKLVRDMLKYLLIGKRCYKYGLESCDENYYKGLDYRSLKNEVELWNKFFSKEEKRYMEYNKGFYYLMCERLRELESRRGKTDRKGMEII